MDMECITSQPLEEIKMNKKTKGKKREKVCVCVGGESRKHFKEKTQNKMAETYLKVPVMIIDGNS